MKNFKLLEDDTIYVDGHTLYRIEATRDFGSVNRGDLGGYIESPDNLGDVAWVYDTAWVYGKAQILENAQVSENARVYGKAIVSGNARVFGKALVCGNALVSQCALVYGNARVFGDAHVYGDANIYGNASVCGGSWVYGNALVSGDACVYGNATIRKGSVKRDRDVINITSNGVLYPITILPRHIQIGCQCHTRTAWFGFTDEEIRSMDGEKAVVWWKTWKPILKSICDANASGDEQC